MVDVLELAKGNTDAVQDVVAETLDDPSELESELANLKWGPQVVVARDSGIVSALVAQQEGEDGIPTDECRPDKP